MEQLTSVIAQKEEELSAYQQRSEEALAEKTREAAALSAQVAHLSEHPYGDLRLEMTRAQEEIGEVLISAKQQAKRTVSGAEKEAERIISTAKLELLSIRGKAKQIFDRISESEQSVAAIYTDMQEKIADLTKHCS